MNKSNTTNKKIKAYERFISASLKHLGEATRKLRNAKEKKLVLRGITASLNVHGSAALNGVTVPFQVWGAAKITPDQIKTLPQEAKASAIEILKLLKGARDDIAKSALEQALLAIVAGHGKR
jgi:hypothetical protein